jgi:DNA topoisomerase IB
LLARTPLPEAPSERALKSEIAAVVKAVAAKLRNTPAVCRKSYINPAVFDSWRAGVIHKVFNGSLSLAAPRKAETLVLAFLRHEARSSGARQSTLARPIRQ